MNIGVLGIQGDIEEHEEMIKKINCNPIRVRTVNDLKNIDALIIPGGESTTIGKLMEKYGFIEYLKNSNLPILGTCAGLVLLSKETGKKQPLLKLIDISVNRNAYGSQKNSFECEINLNNYCNVKAFFIRAPVIDKILTKHNTNTNTNTNNDNENVKIIAKEGNNIVGVVQNKYMAISFHPELCEEGYKVYEYFLNMVVKK